MKQLVSAAFILYFMIVGCSKPDSRKYKILDTGKLSCELVGVRTLSEQFDQGVMTPIDGIFIKMKCSIPGTGGKKTHKDIKTIGNKITDGVVKTANYGEVYITFHGPNNAGLYDGTVTKSEYYDPKMHQRFYMTDYQVREILNFLDGH